MKLSSTTVEKLKSEWTGVVLMRNRMKRIVMFAFVGGSPGSGFSALAVSAVRDIVYNLPLLLAFDVLKQALAEAKNENLFVCSGNRPGLTQLMHCGKHSLPWIDWDALLKGIQHRNAIAHDGELFDQEQCLQDIASVETQLLAWDIIDTV
jgi:hypothetical protein